VSPVEASFLCGPMKFELPTTWNIINVYTHGHAEVVFHLYYTEYAYSLIGRKLEYSLRSRQGQVTRIKFLLNYIRRG
jgi:hypothetical protein